MDYNITVSENTVKEVSEESGYKVITEEIIAVQNRNLHNSPRSIFEVIKIFVKCRMIDGNFKQNLETSNARFFSKQDIFLLDLDSDKTTIDQIIMCFEQCRAKDKKVVFD